MPRPNRARVLYLSYLSRPASDRLVYRTTYRRQPRSILELGIGVTRRTVRMLEIASWFHPSQAIHYTGIDPFEGRSVDDGPGVTVKMAHRLLKATGARIRLVPGGPFLGLSQVANTLGPVDLVVISSRVDPEELARAWLYVPRLLHDQSQVVLQALSSDGRTSSRLLDRGEIEALAAAASPRRHAA